MLQELLAIGFANIAGSFFSAYPVTGSFSRTAVNFMSGVKTPLAGLFTAGIVMLGIRYVSGHGNRVAMVTVAMVTVAMVTVAMVTVAMVTIVMVTVAMVTVAMVTVAMVTVAMV